MNIDNILKNAQKSKKKVHISATIPYDLKVKLDDLSKTNKITLSKLIETILNEFLEVASSDTKDY